MDTKALSRELKSDSRGIDHEVRKLEREQAKIVEEIKKAARAGDKKTAGVLARSLVSSREHTERLQQMKVKNTAVEHNIKSAGLHMKMTGHMATTARVMEKTNGMMNVSQLQQTTNAYAKQVQKLEITQEMMSDMVDGLDDDLEDEVDQEVENVILEVTKDRLGAVKIPKTEHRRADPQEADVDQELEARLRKLVTT